MSAPVYAIGVDWGGDKHDVCVLGTEGRTIQERAFDETAEGFTKFGRYTG